MHKPDFTDVAHIVLKGIAESGPDTSMHLDLITAALDEVYVQGYSEGDTKGWADSRREDFDE